MPACLTAFLPEAAARWLLRSHAPLTLGRAAGCSLRIDHPSVSRLHARLRFDGDWILEDAGSKNGVHRNGLRVEATPLGGHAWFRLGDVACEWSTLDDAAADRMEARGVEKRATSRFMVESLQRQDSLPGMLRDTLAATLELAECERGFLLLAEDGGLRVAASHGVSTSLLDTASFSGSVGAVQQALQAGRPLVIHDASGDPRWAGRASIAEHGLRTVLCLPLRVGDDTVALVYADSAQPGGVITSTDVELLQAFGERAALWIAAHRGLDDLARLGTGRAAWTDIVAAQGMAPA